MTGPGPTPQRYITAPAQILAQLKILLRPQEVDEPRAQLTVELAMERVRMVIDPIPEKARAILLDVARRGYDNPSGVQSETRAAGPFNESRTFRAPGVYLLDQERADLAAMAAKANGQDRGAYTIRPFGGRGRPLDIPPWP